MYVSFRPFTQVKLITGKVTQCCSCACLLILLSLAKALDGNHLS